MPDDLIKIPGLYPAQGRQKIVVSSKNDRGCHPQYERGYIYVQHKQVKDIKRTRVGGDPNFNYARIEAP